MNERLGLGRIVGLSVVNGFGTVLGRFGLLVFKGMDEIVWS